MVPADILDRFRSDLDALISANERIGVAVSGGPDSLALLLLAVAARPDRVEAATVDHGLRSESRSEAEDVAVICSGLGTPHETLTVDWETVPTSAIQQKARSARYSALAAWMRRRGLAAILTGHHLDDQAETLVMRLNRGSGVTGLAGMRPDSPVLGASGLKLLRPLLGWRRSDLEAICAAAGYAPADDPSNSDLRHERVTVRRAMAGADWLDSSALARSAAYLAAADDALEWAVEREWTERVTGDDQALIYEPSDAPMEIRRRLVARAIATLANEGPAELRGRELDRLISALEAASAATLRGVRCEGGPTWRFTPATPRKLAK